MLLESYLFFQKKKKGHYKRKESHLNTCWAPLSYRGADWRGSLLNCWRRAQESGIKQVISGHGNHNNYPGSWYFGQTLTLTADHERWERPRKAVSRKRRFTRIVVHLHRLRGSRHTHTHTCSSSSSSGSNGSAPSTERGVGGAAKNSTAGRVGEGREGGGSSLAG